VKDTKDGRLILDTVSLWDEICRRGLQPGKEGRDEALLDELRRRLNLRKKKRKAISEIS
jgi:hypothetical protein